jgi:hypothetical protein
LQEQTLWGASLTRGVIAMLGFAIFAYCAWGVRGAMRNGIIEPIISRGCTPLFRRRERPWAFWTSVLWNSLVGIGGLFGCVQIVRGH